MRTPHRFLSLVAVLLACASCSRTVEIANNDPRGLADAIHRANASPGADRIRLARNGLYVFSHVDSAGLVLPVIREKLLIEGNGAEIRSYSGDRVALLEIHSQGDLTLSALSLAEGTRGAIRNFGKLTLEATRVIDSSGSGISAIVLNHGVLVARDSEIAYNRLEGSQRDAGTLLNYGELRLENTSIHDNSVQRAHAGIVAAGSVLNLGTLRMTSTRMHDNLANDLRQFSQEQAHLRFPGVLNLGNGVTEGEFTGTLIRNAGL